MDPSSGQVSVASLKQRRFSFYPAIRNIEHNEWTLDVENWSELHVVNNSSGLEIWIPRNYVGTVSSSEAPVLIVGLTRELEFKAGAVWPYRKTVIEMPSPRTPREAGEGDSPGAANRAINRSDFAESRIGWLLAAALVVGLVVCLALVLAASERLRNPFSAWFQPATETADQRYLSLNGADSYHDIVLKIGEPGEEQWISSESAELQFELLRYPTRSYTVVLMGVNRAGARYIGTLHEPSRRVLDSAQLPGGGSTTSLLRNLPDY